MHYKKILIQIIRESQKRTMCDHDFKVEEFFNPRNKCKWQKMKTCKKCLWFEEDGDEYIECARSNLKQTGIRRTPSHGQDCTLNVCMDCGTNVEI